MNSSAIDRRPSALGDFSILPDETICSILDLLSPPDLARLSCASSVMYVFCNEEPMWMSKCLESGGELEYADSWKKTTLLRQNLCAERNEISNKRLHFDGFFSLFLYKRWYRCHTSLNSFSFDSDDLERKQNISLNEFSSKYDGKNPILIVDLAETWLARNKWTFENLVLNYGDIKFRISQRSPKKVWMKLKDYVSYMQVQNDEEPLYIFDDKFGEAAPELLKDYQVPELFKEDYFDILNEEERPPYRWLIIGPERSGASWHVDPGLTSAWNTLLCGQKRWALYPPGRVPAGVTVHVNEENGDVSIEGPTSLQWWLEIYPQLSEENKPIELTQRVGETIFVPTGWWHCVLNIESTIAVTQNYVNSSNLGFVCLDLAPGFRHKGVSRAGLLALGSGNPNYDQNPSFDVPKNPTFENIDPPNPNSDEIDMNSAHPNPNFDSNPNFDNEVGVDLENGGDITRKEKRRKCPSENEDFVTQNPNNYEGFKYDVEYLSGFLEKDKDHYSSAWNPNIYIGQREMRGWLQKLWIHKPQIRDLIWKGACLAINVEKWYKYVVEICTSHNLPVPTIDEKLPVGTGSNPVFIVSNNVIKIFVEGGFESSLHCLGTELEFYEILKNSNSALKVPEIIASGFILLKNDFIKTIKWNGKGISDEISELYRGAIGGISEELIGEENFSFGVWKKMEFVLEDSSFEGNNYMIFPYLVTKKIQGDIFANIRDKMTKDDVMNLSSFLGAQLRFLHELPLPSLNINLHKTPQKSEILRNFEIPKEWEFFLTYLQERINNAKIRLEQWGDPIPAILIEKVEEYLPKDSIFLLDLIKGENGVYKVSNSPSWIHSDVMDDNILMQPLINNDSTVNDSTVNDSTVKWIPSHLIDFSDLSIGDRLLDIIPLYLDVFRGEKYLLKKFLETYALPFSTLKNHNIQQDSKFSRISYRAMCYCILHDENVLGALFSLGKELKSAESWEIVEYTVWGELNDYQLFSL